MSYEIIYDKQFIKAKKEGQDVFVPMLYWGSNNCYEASSSRNGNGRRSRDWSNMSFITNGRIYTTLEEMILKAQQELKERTAHCEADDYFDKANYKPGDVEKHFGYYTSLAIGGSTRKTTYGAYEGLFRTGCKKALTVEELLQCGVSVVVYMYYFDEAKLKEKGLEPFRLYPKTSDEFISMVDEKMEYLKDSGYNVSISLHASEQTMKRIRREKFPIARKNQGKEYVYVNEYFNLTNENGAFLKNTRNGYRYTYDNYGGKKFGTEKEANTFKKNMSGGDKWTVTKHERRGQVLMPKIIIEKVEAL